MYKLIDLSQSIGNNIPIPVYPGDDQATLVQSRFLENHFYNDHRLETGMHVGTHVDGPMHLTESNQYIHELPLGHFMGAGCVLDVRGSAVIEMKDEYRDQIPQNGIVLLYTGMSQHYGQEPYYRDYPEVSPALAEYLIEKQIKILGIDACSPDRPPCTIHKMLFAHDILVMENLTNLDALLPFSKFEVMAFPLKLRADSSLVRAVALVR